MSSLHRTQIYLREEQMQQLKFEAQRERLVVSELIRRAIQYFLESKAGVVDWEKDSLTKTIGRIKLGVNNASVQHDHYLYGQRKVR